MDGGEEVVDTTNVPDYIEDGSGAVHAFIPVSERCKEGWWTVGRGVEGRRLVKGAMVVDGEERAAKIRRALGNLRGEVWKDGSEL